MAGSTVLYNPFVEKDWHAMESAMNASVPDDLTEREAAIYRAGYANGHYDALHPTYVEGV